MSGFEIAGVIIAGPAIVERLLQVSLDGYRVFQNAKMVGKEIQQCGYELDITRVRLEDWMRALTKCGGDLSVVLGGKSRRYQLVLETLALIAGVFAQVEQLEKKYGIARVNLDQSRVKKLQPGEKGLGIGGWVKKYFHPPRQISSSGRSRSSSPAPKHSQSHNSSAWLPPTNLSSILDDENAILKYSRDLDLEFDARRLGECIAQMEEVAREYQQTLSTFRKYEWLFSSREELQLLIEDLKRYITSLETLTSVPFKIKFKTTFQNFTPFNEFQVPIKLPFSRLSKFTGREEILHEMEDLLHPMVQGKDHCSRRVVILHGMGGIGKSQIALEYAYLKSTKYSTIFWLDATDHNTINASGRQITEILILHYATKYPSSPDFPRIATDLGIPGQIDSTGKLMEGSANNAWLIVQSWMAREGNSAWCLIADGINDEADAVRLLEVLPKCGHGHIIITSRVRVSKCDRIIDIPAMDKESGLKLLLDNKELECLTEDDKDAAEAIVEKLGYLPLALSQAVAYMVTRALDFIEYLHRLCEDVCGFIGRSFPPYADGVFSCWKLSVQALQESNPDAIPLLRLCSFLSPEGVSKELLYRGLKSMHWLNCSRIRLDEAIDDLVKYALMKRKSSPTSHVEGRSLWIHPLVQLWARETYGDGKSIILEREPLRLAQVRKEGAKKAICLVGIAVNVEDNTRGSSEWIFERENMAHLNLCYDEYIPNYVLEDDNIADEELAQVLRKLGVLKYYWSDYPLAADLILKSLRMYERLPHASRDTEVAILLAKQNLACVYINRDLLGCSIENIALLIDETVLGQRLLLGELHRDTLSSISLKASCLRIQGDLDGSVELYQHCIEKIQKALTEGDPVIMATTNDFAFLYETRREYDKALELYERSLDLYYKYRGANHQDTLIILDNIARFKYKMGDYEKTREYFQRLAKGCEETFGLANSLTLKAIEQLMEICLQMKQFDDALRATEQYLEGWKILYGKEHCRGRHILEDIGRQRIDSYAAERKNPSMELVESAKDIEMSEAGN